MKTDFLYAAEAESIIVSYAPRPHASGQGHIRASWVQIVVAVLQAAIKMSNEQKFANWQSQVSDQLNQILSGLADIQRQLHDLKVWTDERISEETRRQYHQRISGLCKDANNILAAIGTSQNNTPTTDQLTDLKSHFRELRLVAAQLMETDGFSHVMGVVCATTTVVPLFTLLDRKSELRGWLESVYAYFGSAISPFDPKSIEFARNLHALDFLDKKKLLEERINKAWLTNYTAGWSNGPSSIPLREPPDHPGKARSGLIQGASGSLADGLALSIRRTLNLGEEPPPWFPELREHYDMGDGFEKPWSDMWVSMNSLIQSALLASRNEGVLTQQRNEIRDVQALLGELRN